MAVRRPERSILLDGVDSTTQAALQSDDEEFYGQQTSSDSSASGESDNDELSTDFTPNMSQGDIDSRARLVSTGRVTRTDSGNASGVFVPQNDPLYEHVAAKLAGECCSENCLSDEVYQLHLNFHEMSKEEKCMFILGKLHVMSRAGELTSHARKKRR